jgi:hypothetical protein
VTQDTPARDFLLPRINAMLTEARGLGISREVAVAVLIDLVTGPGFNDVPLDPTQDAPPVHPDNFPMELSEVAIAEGEAVPVDPTGSFDITRRGYGGRPAGMRPI